MSVVVFPLDDERIAEAVQTLNRMGPEAVAQAAHRIIEDRHCDPPQEERSQSARSKLYLVPREEESS